MSSKIKDAMNACRIESKAISAATDKLIKDLNKKPSQVNGLINTFNKDTVYPLDKKIQKMAKKITKHLN